MGFKINYSVDRQFVDEYAGVGFYNEAIYVTGNSVTDSIVIRQEDQVISLNESQFHELVEKALHSSIFYKLVQDIKNDV